MNTAAVNQQMDVIRPKIGQADVCPRGKRIEAPIGLGGTHQK